MFAIEFRGHAPRSNGHGAGSAEATEIYRVRSDGQDF